MTSRRSHIIVFFGIGFVCLGLLISFRSGPDLRRNLNDHLVYQSSRNGCAPASLTMVLQTIGVQSTLDSVEGLFRMEPAGASISEIARVAELFGVKSTARRIRPAELARSTLPCIVFIDNDHYAVLDSMQGAWLYVRDPARGSQSLPVHDFLARWNGIIVEFEQKSAPS